MSLYERNAMFDMLLVIMALINTGLIFTIMFLDKKREKEIKEILQEEMTHNTIERVRANVMKYSMIGFLISNTIGILSNGMIWAMAAMYAFDQGSNIARVFFVILLANNIFLLTKSLPIQLKMVQRDADEKFFRNDKSDGNSD